MILYVHHTKINSMCVRTKVKSYQAAARALQQIRSWGAAIVPVRVVLFLVLSAWYVHSYVGTRLIFWAQNDMFLWNLRFLRDFLVSPGAPAEWLGKLLLQSHSYGWPGAAVIAATAWLLFLATIGFMKRISRTEAGATWMVPAILLVVLHGQYLFRISTVVGLTLAMAAAGIYVRARIGHRWLRLVLFVAASLLVYYVAGAAYYVFAACCLIYELLVERRLLTGLSFLAAAPAIKFGLDYALSLIAAPLPYMELEARDYEGTLMKAGVLSLYLYFPACALFLAIKPACARLLKRAWQGLLKRTPDSRSPSPRERIGRTPKNPDKRKEPIRHGSAPQPARAHAIRRWCGVSLMLLAVAGAAGYFSLDRETRTLTAIDYFSSRQMWNELLQEVREVPPRLYSHYVNCDVNRALYHTGRLPYEMFSYPQVYDLFLPPYTERHSAPGLYRLSDFYLQVGRVNEAEHFAHEELEARKSARALQHLALIKMIKGETAAARVFLNVLRDDLVYGSWAEDYLQRLRQGGDVFRDPEIARVLPLRIDEEDSPDACRLEKGGSLASSVQRQLLNLWRRNPRNRMAVEYLMALCLVDRQLDILVDAFGKLDISSFYPAVPPLYEEAMMMYADRPARSEAQQERKKKHVVISETGVSVCGRPISEATLKRFHRLAEIEKQFGSLNNPMAKAAAARELGKTYFFYYVYGHGGPR